MDIRSIVNIFAVAQFDDEHVEGILLRILSAVANKHFDGHFTVMKFTKEWRVSLGYQPNSYEDIQLLPKAEKLADAIAIALLMSNKSTLN